MRNRLISQAQFHAWSCQAEIINNNAIQVVGNSYSSIGEILWNFQPLSERVSTSPLSLTSLKRQNYFTINNNIKKLSDWGVVFLNLDKSKYNTSLFLFKTYLRFQYCQNWIEVLTVLILESFFNN